VPTISVLGHKAVGSFTLGLSDMLPKVMQIGTYVLLLTGHKLPIRIPHCLVAWYSKYQFQAAV